MSRVKFSTQVDADLVDRVRAAVRALPRYVDNPPTLAALTEAALASYVAELEQRHNDGDPWPPVDSLPRGPRVGDVRQPR